MTSTTDLPKVPATHKWVPLKDTPAAFQLTDTRNQNSWLVVLLSRQPSWLRWSFVQ